MFIHLKNFLIRLLEKLNVERKKTTLPNRDMEGHHHIKSDFHSNLHYVQHRNDSFLADLYKEWHSYQGYHHPHALLLSCDGHSMHHAFLAGYFPILTLFHNRHIVCPDGKMHPLEYHLKKPLKSPRIHWISACDDSMKVLYIGDNYANIDIYINEKNNKFHIWAYDIFVETKTSLKDAKKVGLIILDVIKHYSKYVSEHALKIIKSPIYK